MIAKQTTQQQRHSMPKLRLFVHKSGQRDITSRIINVFGSWGTCERSERTITPIGIHEALGAA